MPAPNHHEQVRDSQGNCLTLGRAFAPCFYWDRNPWAGSWRPQGATDLSRYDRRKLQLLILGTFQYAFFKAVAVFLGLVLATDGNYNPADVSARAWGWAR